MTGYECFKLFLPLKFHFTNVEFDVFRTPRLKNTSNSHYLKRRDRFVFEKLGNQFGQPREFVRYCVANFVYMNDNFLYDRVSADAHFLRWNRVRQSITNTVRDDFTKISELLASRNMGKIVLSPSYTEIFNMFVNNEINPESLVILNSYTGIFNKWDIPEFELIFGDNLLRLKKAERFVIYDKEKIDKVYDEFKNEILL